MRMCKSRIFEVIFSFLLFFSLSSSAQNNNQAAQAQNNPARERYFTWGLNFGMLGWSPTSTQKISGTEFFTRTFNSGYGVVQDVSGRKQISIGANTSVGLSGGILFSEKNSKNFTGVQLEFQKNKACYTFVPPFNFSAQGDTFAAWVMNDKYLKYSIAVQQCWLRNNYSFMGGESFFYVRESFGQTFHHRNFDQRLELGHFEDWSQNGKGMTSTTVNVNQSSMMLSSEIGIRSFSYEHDRSLDFGIVFHAPFSKTYTDQYEFFQQHTSVGKSNVTYGGSTILLNLRYTFNYKIKTPPPDTTHPKELYVVQPDTAGRKIEVQSSIVTNRKSIKVKVWDRDEIDGDSITLILNGRIIKEHIALKGRKQTFTIHLDEGANYLVMNAENLGSIPPNTAAVEVIDGHKKKRMQLSSDKGKSGAIKITRK